MRPIRFECTADIRLPPGEISSGILDLSRWPDFNGYGLVPGIKHAEFILKTEDIVGTRFQVWNADGSSHMEEILNWEPDSRVVMKLHQFSRPLDSIAQYFIEEWQFDANQRSTRVRRSFQMVPRSWITRLPLWGISLLFRRAIAHHLQLMQREAEAGN